MNLLAEYSEVQPIEPRPLFAIDGCFKTMHTPRIGVTQNATQARTVVQSPPSRLLAEGTE